jgi:hypothetical protein
MALYIEKYLEVIQQNGGLASALPVDLSAAATCALPAATTVGGASISALGTVTSASANALVVGLNGATNPAFNIDASTALSATGVNVKSAAAAGGVAVSVLSSGTNENLTIDAKGSGTVTLNGTGTGNIVLGRAATGVSLSTTGKQTAYSGTAVPATAGAAAAGVPVSLYSNAITVECTTDVPTHNRPIGSLCINLGGNSASTRLYIATSAAGAWAAITTAS